MPDRANLSGCSSFSLTTTTAPPFLLATLSMLPAKAASVNARSQVFSIFLSNSGLDKRRYRRHAQSIDYKELAISSDSVQRTSQPKLLFRYSHSGEDSKKNVNGIPSFALSCFAQISSNQPIGRVPQGRHPIARLVRAGSAAQSNVRFADVFEVPQGRHSQFQPTLKYRPDHQRFCYPALTCRAMRFRPRRDSSPRGDRH